MAADLDIVDIRHIVGREMDPLLLEATVEWDRELDWDFAPSAEAIRRCVEARELIGCALLERGEVVAYGYTAYEDHKGIVGDMYVRPAWRNGVSDIRIFRMLLERLLATPGLRRLESQTMLVERGVVRAASEGLGAEVFDRTLMGLELSSFSGEAAAGLLPRYRLDRWSEHRHFEGAASLITLAYEGHIDSRINDQYCGLTGARRFVRNILQFPGCGMFFAEGSYAAMDAETGRMAGLILMSFVGPKTGHITQICVAPWARGNGLGRGLLCTALASLQDVGGKRSSLTVTDVNETAIALYHSVGFAVKRRFAAVGWAE